MIKRFFLLAFVIGINCILVLTKETWLPLTKNNFDVVHQTVDNLKETILRVTGHEQLDEPEITFADKALENAIRYSLNINDRPLYTQDMELLRSLDLSGKSIQDLSGIEFANKLTRISFSENPIQSIDPLAEMPQITYLDLSYVDAKNLEPLIKINSLQKVVLSQSPHDYKNNEKSKSVLKLLNEMGVQVIWVAKKQVSQEVVSDKNDNNVGLTSKIEEEKIIFEKNPIMREWKSNDGKALNAKLIAVHNSNVFLLSINDQIEKWGITSLSNDSKIIYDYWRSKNFLTSQPNLLRRLRALDPSMREELIDKEVEFGINIHTMYMSGSNKLFLTFGETRTDTYGLIEMETLDIITWFGYDPADPDVQYYMEDQNKELMVKAAWEEEPVSLLKVNDFIKINGKIDQSDETRLKLVNTRLID